MRIVIQENDQGKRLDHVLRELYPEHSRSLLQKWIKDGSVTVNEKTVSVHHFLKKEDTVSIAEPQAADPKPQTSTPPTLTIIAETDEYLVIDKPSGVVVHPGVMHESDTIVDALLLKYPELAGVGDDPVRPGIVHRLDKDASGLMLIAKTQASFDSLKTQFKTRSIKKQYVILVHGHVEPREGLINIPLKRSAKSYLKYVASPHDGREALTNYWVEQYFMHYTLVRVEPHTGRTHQIRVHFFSKGYPIVGDTMYTKKDLKRIEGARLMLHATLLEFRDLSEELQRYECPPRKDFTKFLDLMG